MQFSRWIPKLQVTIGDYNVTDRFYVVNVVDTNVVSRFQLLYSIVNRTIDYQFLEMKFQDAGGKEVELRVVNTYPKQVVIAHSMRSIIIHGYIEWDVMSLF